ncbi:MAG: large protein, partial [Chitinophagaceae bacterium]|nr:large protein [Chitinophagaceae bacterium]
AHNINIFAASANQGKCKAVYDTLQVTFQPAPTAIAGSPVNTCANVASIALLGSVFNATGGKWSTTGSGSFSNPITQLNNTYTPSPGDRTAGTVTLVLSTTGNAQCSPVFSNFIVTIAPSPLVTANPAILCTPTLGAPLSGTVTNATGGIWSSSSAGGNFSPSPTLLSATYYPSPAEITAGRAVLTLTSSGNGSCNPENASIDIVIEPLPIADAGPDQFTCSNGQVNLASDTIQPAVSYTWAVSGGAVLSSSPYATATVTANTGYVLTASDSKGCHVNDTMQVSIFTIPVSFNLQPTPLCFSENMTINSNPSTIPVQGGTFQWYKDGVLIQGANKTFINPSVAGVYKIKYFFSNSCTTEDSKTLNSPPQVTTEDVVDCHATTDLEAVLINPANYPSGVAYNWPATGATTSLITVPVAPNDTALYYVNVTDNATLCVAQDSVYLIGLPVPALTPIDSIACQGSTVKLYVRPSNIANVNQFLKLGYTWTQNGVLTNDHTDSITVTQDSLYVGTITIDRCIASVTDKVKFTPYPTSTLPDRVNFCDEKTVTLTLDAGSGAAKYVWETGNPTDTLQTLEITPTATIKYFVTLTSQYHCSITDSILVRDICEPRVFNPTGFNPGCSSCGNNNVFQIYGAHLGKFSISIFNRWGEVIFYTEDINHSWDGIYRGEIMPIGVYPFIIYYEGTEEYSNIHNTIKGKVTLLR